jgi:hypothetical protein
MKKKEHLHEPQEWEWQLAEQEFKEHRDASEKEVMAIRAHCTAVGGSFYVFVSAGLADSDG